jgi:hypothetical protein
VRLLLEQLNFFLTEERNPQQQAASYNTWLKQCEVCTENSKQVGVICDSHQSMTAKLTQQRAAHLYVLSGVSFQKFGVNEFY